MKHFLAFGNLPLHNLVNRNTTINTTINTAINTTINITTNTTPATSRLDATVGGARQPGGCDQHARPARWQGRRGGGRGGGGAAHQLRVRGSQGDAHGGHGYLRSSEDGAAQGHR